RALEVHPLELGARFWPAVEVAVHVNVHRAFVLGIVVGTGAFVAVEDLDHVSRKVRAQALLLSRPVIDESERRAQNEAHDAARAREDMLEREHSAPRSAEQVDALELELVADVGDFFTKDVGAPLDVGRPIRAPAADLVVEYDGTFVREPL